MKTLILGQIHMNLENLFEPGAYQDKAMMQMYNDLTKAYVRMLYASNLTGSCQITVSYIAFNA